jgi:hypothetical protein
MNEVDKNMEIMFSILGLLMLSIGIVIRSEWLFCFGVIILIVSVLVLMFCTPSTSSKRLYNHKLRFTQYVMYDEDTNTQYWCPVKNPTRPPFPGELKLKEETT